ncbi:hypothetical protein PV387_40065 [Streptomyces sp. ME02-6987-2C]|nr:hypothetical protein [Streptomyces sp. ME02-6987-2C]MDX3372111.1 hypothetical protein [Streptomyces sp. ME02-6987-2C]MDX3427233.1 hypothetical protein [Streptomyces sp. ME02-6985-2c]
METAWKAYVDDDADVCSVRPFLLLGHGAMADPQMRAGPAD